MKHNDNKNELKPMNLLSLLLSFLSLFVISGLLFFAPQPDTYKILLTLDTVICALFIFQLTIDLIRSNNRKKYLQSHWIDFVASIPLIEPLRYGRIIQILRVIRLIRSGKQIWRQLMKNRKEATFASILFLLVMLLTVGSGLIIAAEANSPEANITTTGDALWWAFVTVSTVGYGDYYPVTTAGKLVAIVVIMCGVGIFGMISGLMTSIITTPDQSREKKQVQQTNKILEEMVTQQKLLLNKVDQLEKQIEQLKK